MRCRPSKAQLSTATTAAGIAPTICSIHCSPPRSGTDRQAIRVVKAATPIAVISRTVAVVRRAIAVAVNRGAIAVKTGAIAIPILCTRRCGSSVKRQHRDQQTCRSSSGNGTIHDLRSLLRLGVFDVLGHEQIDDRSATARLDTRSLSSDAYPGYQ